MLKELSGKELYNKQMYTATNIKNNGGDTYD